MSARRDTVQSHESGGVGVRLDSFDQFFKNYQTIAQVDKFSEEQCDFARVKLGLAPDAPVSSKQLLLIGAPEEILVVEGNLLLNEGLQRMRDLLVAAGGVAYNNANAFLGVGDSSTAEVATQTELQAATNRFYKGLNATFPTTAGQAATWASDFTSAEANYVWAEWSLAAGATTASGAGFTSGTTNLNRKVAALGTKTVGTWTLTITITFS